MNNNQFKPVAGRVYQHLGNKYRCINSNSRFKLDDQWYDSVLYELEDKSGLIDSQIFSCTLRDWLTDFIPAYIEPKDCVIAESMGKILGVYEVQETQFDNDIYARNITGGNDDFLMFEHLEVQPRCQVAVKFAGSIEHLRKNALFFLVPEEYKKDVLRSRTLDDTKSQLLNLVKRIRRLNNLDTLNQVIRTLEDFLNNVK